MAKERVAKQSIEAPVDKHKGAADAAEAINKKHGSGSIMKFGDKVGQKYPSIPTGLYELDNYVIGAGGIPRSKITEIFGDYSSGKTTLVLQTIANAQKQGGMCAFIDAEHALNVDYSAALGVDMDQLLVSQPDSAEEALDIAESLARSKSFDMIVIDSVAALVPIAEINNEIGASNMGLHSRLMSSALRKLTPAVGASGSAFVMLNQLRSKIGVVYGDPNVTSGGRALSFFASLRLQLYRSTYEKDGEEVVGNKVRIKAVKNKFANPFRECTADMIFGKGLDAVGSLFDYAALNGLYSKSGAWYVYGEQKWQGRDAAVQSLRDDQALYDNVYSAVVEKDNAK